MTTLIIARHGNTFTSDQTPTRVGARTDLPLVQSGIEQAKALGLYLKENNIHPDRVYTSNLIRTQQTALTALEVAGINISPQPLSIFNEIDYGPDENQTEDKVISRIGEQAIKDWDDKAIVPDGWRVEPDKIIKDWENFAENIKDGETILVVTSNGIARFAPHITGDFETFRKNYKIKLSTGALGILNRRNGQWAVEKWGLKPLHANNTPSPAR